MTEIWLPVPGYEGHYQVSSEGRIYSCFARRGDGFMRGTIDNYGYNRVFLTKDGERRRFKWHRIVCAAFNGPQPEGREVGHLNGNKLDNRAVNLAWITRAENNEHQFLHGTRARKRLPGQRRPAHRKLSDAQVAAMRNQHSGGTSAYRLAKEFGVCKRTAQRIVNRTHRIAASGDAPERKIMSDEVKLLPCRYHVEGETSTEGPRWQIWDTEVGFAPFHGFSDDCMAQAVCDRLNEHTRAIEATRPTDIEVRDAE